MLGVAWDHRGGQSGRLRPHAYIASAKSEHGGLQLCQPSPVTIKFGNLDDKIQ